MVAEQLVSDWGLRWGRERFRSRIAEGRTGGDGAVVGGPRVVVMLPQTYMNEVGRAVGPARGAFRVALEHVLVIHDEIDLPFGELRARVGGGLAGHNGLKSLRRGLGSPDFARLRVGVGRPDSTDPDVVSAWVLGRFGEPRDAVRELVRRAAAEAERLVREEAQVGP
jgi:PTH1 family peptidyl-tRNA hydrolase